MGTADNAHGMIISYLSMFNQPLPVVLQPVPFAHPISLIHRHIGLAMLPVESIVIDTSLPTYSVSLLKGAVDEGHHTVERHIEATVVVVIVGAFKGETAMEGMMGAARQGYIIARKKKAVGKLKRRVGGAEHVDGRGKIACLTVEGIAKTFFKLGQ